MHPLDRVFPPDRTWAVGAVSHTPSPRVTREVVETRILRVLWYVGVVFFLVITMVPFLYGFMLSIRTIESLAADPGAIIPPLESITFDTYGEVMRSVEEGGQGFVTFLRNSAIIAVVAVFASLLIAIPGAYAVARLRFFGRRTISGLFLAVYLFPAILLAIPLFVIFTRIGLRGSLIGLMIVYASQTVPITIYMLSNTLTPCRRPSRRPRRSRASIASRSSATLACRLPRPRSWQPACSCS